jgi:hypothetical protein
MPATSAGMTGTIETMEKKTRAGPQGRDRLYANATTNAKLDQREALRACIGSTTTLVPMLTRL